MNNVLYLRGVDWQKLLDKYLDGEFSDDTLNSSNKIKLKTSYEKPLLRGLNGDSPTFTYKDDGATVLVYTTNCKQYEAKRDECLRGSEGEGGLAVVPGQRCKWCREEIKGKPLGIPVAYLKNRLTGEHIIHMEGAYCTFECTFSGLKSKDASDLLSRYRDSEAVLRLLFSLVYPDEPFREAPPWDAHEINQGTLSSEAFHDRHHQYVELGGWFLLPCKQMYRQITI